MIEEESGRPSHSLVCFKAQSHASSGFLLTGNSSSAETEGITTSAAQELLHGMDIILQHKPVNFPTESRTTQTVNHAL